MKNNPEIPKKDWLALERTKLANERTFLAYFRSAIVFMGGGLSILKLQIFSNIKLFGFVLLILAAIILLVGIVRLYTVRKSIRKHFYKM